MKPETEVARWLKRRRGVESVQKLPGDASTRMYFRVKTTRQSFIVMKTEGFTKEGERYPFLATQKFLRGIGVDVPEIIESDPEKGLLLLEDLGDITLLRKLQDAGDVDLERHLYERVIDQLITMQNGAELHRSGSDLAAFKMRFDLEKLMWEIGFTISEFYEKHLGRDFRTKDRKTLVEGFTRICRVLDAQPVVFTHRDFHSRNIMVVRRNQRGGASRANQPADRFVMIDFQDARMGPAQYDLASLLKDSYYQLEEAQIKQLLDYYIVRYGALSGDTVDRDEFMYVFDLMSVQRNFKAIGSFASFYNGRGNPGYLKYIGNTFENIRRTLLRHPEFASLREVLFHYYYF